MTRDNREVPVDASPVEARKTAGGGAAKVLVAFAVGLGVGIGAYAIAARKHASSEPEVAAPSASQQLWTCGMHPQVIQDHPGECPICHMALTPIDAERVGGGAAPPASERKVKYWWDPMLDPPYISDRPGKSPMGMDLVPVYEDEAPHGPMVTIDPAAVQTMGVRTARVREAAVTRSVRAFGALTVAEPNVHEVNLRVSGWIRRLHADTEGMWLSRGEPLFELYSPELYAAIEELIAARRAEGRRKAVGEGDLGPTIGSAAAAARKLELLGFSESAIARWSARSRAPTTVTIPSPATGFLRDKSVVEGAAVTAGQPILRIVDQRELWIDARVFEQDLAGITIGKSLVAEVATFPGEQFSGEVSFIAPALDPVTRTATVRFRVDNDKRRLRPGMFATVRVEVVLAPRTLVVPREAVIDTGARQIAFVDQGGGHFEARDVTLGAAGDEGEVEVRAGLMAGESVVTSGQFLLDAESRTREAIQKFLAGREGAMQGAAAGPGTSEPGAPMHVPEAKEPPRGEDRMAKPPPDHPHVDVPAASGAEPPAEYTCPMHPEVLRDDPGPCPVCGMDLVPHTGEEGTP